MDELLRSRRANGTSRKLFYLTADAK